MDRGGFGLRFFKSLINHNVIYDKWQVDENVHFRHTARLINALIAARRPYELLLFPDGRHSLRKAEDRLYLEQRCVVPNDLVLWCGLGETGQLTRYHTP